MFSLLYNYFYNFVANYLFLYFNYFLDFTLFYKIYLQDSSYFKFFQNYLYPPNHLLSVILSNNNYITNFTENFYNLSIENSVIDWNDIIQLLDDNVIITDKLQLHIKYIINNNIYRIIYNYNQNSIILFPPYSLEEINEYNNITTYKKSILCVELCKKDNNEDITEILKEYCGPLNDFYMKKNIKMYGYMIKDAQGENIIKDDEYIKITDNYANDLEIRKEDILELK